MPQPFALRKIKAEVAFLPGAEKVVQHLQAVVVVHLPHNAAQRGKGTDKAALCMAQLIAGILDTLFVGGYDQIFMLQHITSISGTVADKTVVLGAQVIFAIIAAVRCMRMSRRNICSSMRWLMMLNFAQQSVGIAV